MKKFVYILIAILTFSISFWLYNFRPLVTAVSLCEISQHSGIYQSKQIHIKGYLEVLPIEENSTDYIFSDFNRGCLTGGELKLSNNLNERLLSDEKLKKTIEELRERKREMLERRDSSGFYLAEVEIVGEIEESTTAHTFPFVIKAEDIKNISPIKFVTFEETQGK